jgi:DNA-directed RNA polymerase subunit RPC12/RpoP
MPTIRTRLVPRQPQAVPIESGTPPVLTGRGESYGDYNYECGNCGRVIIQSVNRLQLEGALMRCPYCQQSSEIPSSQG